MSQDIDELLEEVEAYRPPDEGWHDLRAVTGGRMSAIWRVAKDEGFNNLREFWAYAHGLGWNFYDVIRIASP